MKIGVKKPNIKKSIKARTTGKVKRQVKKAVNPMYGKKGMGMINDPKKAVYNKVYNKTTFGVSDISSGSKTNGQNEVNFRDEAEYLRKLREMSPEDFTDEELDAMSIEELAAIHNGEQYRKESKFASVAFKVLSVAVAIIFGLPGLFGGIFPLFIIAIILAVVFWKMGNAMAKEGTSKNK